MPAGGSASTPPPAPTDVVFDPATATLSWKAEIDFESGLQAFLIERDGKIIGQVPEEPRNRYGRKLFQGMSYGDTPELPLQEFRFVDGSADKAAGNHYRVIAVNSAGLKSS